jgi:hypothetical protein
MARHVSAKTSPTTNQAIALSAGAPLDGETEEKIDRTQRTRGRAGALEDLFRKPQGLKKGVEAFEILELTREALVVEPLGFQVRGDHDRGGKMLHATPHVPIFGMGELAQDVQGALPPAPLPGQTDGS